VLVVHPAEVNRIFFDILPVLAPGVLIRIHDVSGDLEYPRAWLEERGLGTKSICCARP